MSGTGTAVWPVSALCLFPWLSVGMASSFRSRRDERSSRVWWEEHESSTEHRGTVGAAAARDTRASRNSSRDSEGDKDIKAFELFFSFCLSSGLLPGSTYPKAILL
jgi:hypothetical protein